MAVIAIIILGTLGTSVFLRINEIEVIGGSKYSANEIIMSSGIKTGNNMMLLRKEKAELSIYAAMPYISEVSIAFRLPDKVYISIGETRAIAVIELTEGFLLIDSAGKILERNERAPSGLIEIRGFMPTNSTVGNALRADLANENRLMYLLEVLDAFEAEGIQRDVSYLDVTNISHINFGYKGIVVEIGTSDNVRSKLSTLSGVIEGVVPDGETGTVYLTDREPTRWAPSR